MHVLRTTPVISNHTELQSFSYCYDSQKMCLCSILEEAELLYLYGLCSPLVVQFPQDHNPTFFESFGRKCYFFSICFQMRIVGHALWEMPALQFLVISKELAQKQFRVDFAYCGFIFRKSSCPDVLSPPLFSLSRPPPGSKGSFQP